MPWKKIVKIGTGILVGGGAGSTVPIDVPNTPDGIEQILTTLIGAIVALVMIYIRSPSDDKE